MSTIYVDGTYLEHNPEWHAEGSPWKAALILDLLKRNNLRPKSVSEIGCGAGEIVVQLSQGLPGTRFHGYEISPQAFEVCRKKESDNIRFFLNEFPDETKNQVDLLLLIDVFEHVEDYMGLLRRLSNIGENKIFHIPLDLSVQSVLRAKPIMNRRKQVGHIHYFTKETALATLEDTGYKIIDYFYTKGSLELPDRGTRANLMQLPRKVGFFLSKDLTVRILGGFSLMVLTE